MQAGIAADTAPSEASARPVAPTSAQEPATQAERRLVTVLFADLVGFTTLAEGRDAEDVRELLGRYFEAAEDVVARYGGTIEKFIGDAVMAVWGAPTAHEDDAERAVRAGLELVSRVAALGDDAAIPDLQLRAGVTTGEAAVTLGARGQGMVAGDLVNTASRLQSIAAPGTVLVGDATHRAAAEAIAFDRAGEQHLKGKAEPVTAWRALHVVARVGGAGRTEGIEPPFVGRERELRLLKDLVDTTGADRRARLVSIVGIGGIGKSRLIWELEKYLDGVVETVYWHQGRSPAYGDGIAFWALGEMVRRRARIAESDDEATTAAKLDEAVTEWITTEDDRSWIRQRLRVLLGLDEPPPSGQREEMFAAWRRFFEYVAERGTAILVFEDLQWADSGLLDFVESMIEWSRAHRLLVITLSRPELLERRPTWGAGQREFISLHLDPLPDEEIRQLVRGMGGGLPGEMVERIVGRAEGIPLYAVETFRMLVDRGILQPRDDTYEVTPDAPRELDVPESLQGLISARLDALDPADRALVQDASILGQSFTLESLAAVTGESVDVLEPRLRALVRREIFVLDVDPRSPERGQYGFVQSLIREVASAILARRDRRARHLAAARYFESLGDDELAGVLATHYLEAHRASASGAEADAVAAQARIALRGAAERSLALGSPELAQTYLEQALSVTSDRADAARLHVEAANAAFKANRFAAAEEHARTALGASEELGDPIGRARAATSLADVLLMASRIEEGQAPLEHALAGLPEGDASPEAVAILAQLGRAEMFANQPNVATTWLERGLVAAARIDDVNAIADMLITRAWAVSVLGRWRESVAILEGALQMTIEEGLTESELRARNNLATFYLTYDPVRSLEVGRPALDTARRIGDSQWVAKLGFLAAAAYCVGDWDWAVDQIEERLGNELPMIAWVPLAGIKACLSTWRGDLVTSQELVAEMAKRTERGTAQDRWGARLAEATWSFVNDETDRAWDMAMRFVSAGGELGDEIDGWITAGHVAGVARDAARLDQVLERGFSSASTQTLAVAHRALFEGARAALDGNTASGVASLKSATDMLRDGGHIWNLALARLVEVAVLPADDEERQAAEAEGPEIAERLGAVTYVEMLDRLREQPRLEPRSAAPASSAVQQPVGQSGS